MNNNDGKFSVGFVMGLLLGGGIVFLIGTRTGKNLVKIVSEQGLDGLLSLLEEYNFGDLEEYEEVENEDEADLTQAEAKADSDGEEKKEGENQEAKSSPKKRFFKRVRR
jgi:hypothetical protein